ncbi:tRNA (adenosine(37)-N6)-threonylcarbamoyltransferase complex ATPase subunit type 1 TsaE [Pseudokineococcus marinus]
MSEVRVELGTAEETRALGRRLGALVRGGDLLVLSGDLGAGKTTLTQALADGLGVRGPVTSPTFLIARVHPSLVGGPALVHVDAYRLGDALELDDLDLDADLEASVVVVEWGRGLVEHLAADRLEVDLHREDADAAAGVAGAGVDGAGDEGAGDEGAGEVDERRTAVLRGVGPRWGALADQLSGS